jgi:hypothetical protein
VAKISRSMCLAAMRVLVLFVKSNPTSSNETFLNLYKNAIEAISVAGKIETRVELIDDILSILISDSGHGMDQATLDKLAAEVSLLEKLVGSGIGLSSAIEDVARWGGSLEVSSRLDHGTTIEISLPKSENNYLFPTSLAFAADMTVVVVDDDPLVHKVWKRKFEKSGLSKNSVKVVHGKTVRAAKKIITDLENNADDYILLIDNDLKHATINGHRLCGENEN